MKLTKENVKVETVNPSNIWDMIESFASYAFNKSHAVAYSLISYQTAKVWTYNKDKFLEYQLNNATSEKVKKALNKAKELGYRVEFPTYHNIVKSDKFVIKDGKITPPIDFDLKYDYLSQFLFSEESKTLKNNMIVRGVMDKAFPDRQGLVELIKNIPKKFEYLPQFPDTDSFREIIKNGELMGIWNVTYEDNNMYKILIKKQRGKDAEIILYKSKLNMPPERLEYNIKQDIKHFKIIRDNQLHNFPNLPIDKLIAPCLKIKEHILDGEKLEEISLAKKNSIKEAIKRELSKSFYDPMYRKIFDEINDTEYIVMVKDVVFNSNYGTIKVSLSFNNIDMDFWIREKVFNQYPDVWINAKKIKKGQMIKVKIKIDSYIAKTLEPVIQYKIREFILPN